MAARTAQRIGASGDPAGTGSRRQPPASADGHDEVRLPDHRAVPRPRSRSRSTGAGGEPPPGRWHLRLDGDHGGTAGASGSTSDSSPWAAPGRPSRRPPRTPPLAVPPGPPAPPPGAARPAPRRSSVPGSPRRASRHKERTPSAVPVPGRPGVGRRMGRTIASGRRRLLARSAAGPPEPALGGSHAAAPGAGAVTRSRGKPNYERPRGHPPASGPRPRAACAAGHARAGDVLLTGVLRFLLAGSRVGRWPRRHRRAWPRSWTHAEHALVSRGARQDFLHKASTRLVRSADTIVIEDLNVVRHGPQPAAGPRNLRLRLGRVPSPAGVQMRTVRPPPGRHRPLLPLVQDMLGVRVPARQAGPGYSALDVPILRHPARPGHQRRQEHPCGRSCRHSPRACPGDACGAGVSTPGPLGCGWR